MKPFFVFIIIISIVACSKKEDAVEPEPIFNKFIKTNTNSANINSIDFITSNEGFLTCMDGKILHTKNSGDNWNETLVDSSGNDIVNTFFMNPNLGFCISASKKTYHFNNGTWTTYSSFENISVNYIQFLTENTWYALTETDSTNFAYVLKTDNAGERWDTISDLYYSKYHKILMIDELNGFVIGNNDNKMHVFKTKNGGDTWNLTAPPSYGTMYNNSLKIHEIIALNLYDVIIVGSGSNKEEGFIMTSSDGGSTWKYSLPLYSIYDCFKANNTIYFVGDELFVAQWEINGGGFSNIYNIENEWKIFNKPSDFLLSEDNNNVVKDFYDFSQIQFFDNTGYLLSKKSNVMFKFKSN